MVQGKCVTFQDTGEFKFKEPDGMTEIDLRRLSELSALSDGSIASIKNYKCKVIKYILVIPLILTLLLCLVISANNLITQKFYNTQPNSELINYYISKISLCKAAKSLETCCSILVETDSDFNLNDCTLENLQAFLEKVNTNPSPFLQKDLDKLGNSNEVFEKLMKQADYIANNFNQEPFEDNLEKTAQNILESFEKDTNGFLDDVNYFKQDFFTNVIKRQKERDVYTSIADVDTPKVDEKDLELSFNDTQVNITYDSNNIVKRHLVEPYEYYDNPNFVPPHYEMDNQPEHVLENSYFPHHLSNDEVLYEQSYPLPESNFNYNHFQEVANDFDEIHLMHPTIHEENNQFYYPPVQQLNDEPYRKTENHAQTPFQSYNEINYGGNVIDSGSKLLHPNNQFMYPQNNQNSYQQPIENKVEPPRKNLYTAPVDTLQPLSDGYRENSFSNQNRENIQSPRVSENYIQENPQQNLDDNKKTVNQQEDTTNENKLSRNPDLSKPNNSKQNTSAPLINKIDENAQTQETLLGENNDIIYFPNLNEIVEFIENNEDDILETNIEPILGKVLINETTSEELNKNIENLNSKERQRQNVVITRIKSDNENQQTKLDASNPTARQGIACYTPSLPYATAPLPYQYDASLRYPQILPILPQMQSYSYVPQNYPKLEQQYSQNLYPVQVANSAGQYYICNPVNTQTNQIAGLPGVEVRVSNTPKLIVGAPLNLRDRARESSYCGFGHVKCADDSKCVREEHICDGKIHCADGSDEKDCSCASRVGGYRLCDKYYDCPNGDDESNCGGCGPNSFNCGDWSYRFNTRATCIPLDKRCDGIPHCPNERDEEGCSVLLETMESDNDVLKVGFTSGFLHHNFRGKWYPACSNSEVWALEACRDDSGPSTLPPLTTMIPINFDYKNSFISSGARIEVVQKCIEGRAVYVECPPPTCGVRKFQNNIFRSEEIDTSAEDIISRFRNKRNTSDPIVGDGRVVGGKACQPGAWPWVVSIYRNGNFHCGGVLINEQWLVTAAHCVEKYWKYYFEVEVGMLRRFSYSPMQQTRFVSNVIPHETYNRASLKNDLALMKLNKPVKFNRYVKPICLPTEFTAGQNYNKGPSPGTICTAIGWGATVEHGADPDNLRQVEVPVLPICKHKEDEAGGDICAGLMEGGKDACQGDSGGPFLCRNPNKPDQWYLAGIVSHGEGCARPNEPGVYTRVPMYKGWIYEHAKDEALPHKKPLNKCPGYVCNVIGKCIPRKNVCDKIVDCLYGDDEIDCQHRSTFATLFKSAMQHMHPHENSVFNYRNTNSTSQEDNTEPTTIITTVSENLITTPKTNLERASFINGSHDNKVIFHSIKGGRFFCKRLLEVIPIHKKCDKIIDCEDGTDERSCKCSDYLKRGHSELLCDGFYDCADFSDETNCGITCTHNQFLCLESKKCISLSQRCDGHVDCRFEEDEQDCVALVSTKTMDLDLEGRPKLKSRGLVAYNWKNQWFPYCGNFADKESKISSEVCNALGFTDYLYYKEVRTKDKPFDSFDTDAENITTCNGLYVKCNTYNVFTHVINHNFNKVIKKTRDFAPWNALIFVDGRYQCSGTLLGHNWVLTSSYCITNVDNFNNHYISALLGVGFLQSIDISGPHEEVIAIDYYQVIDGSDFLMMHLKHNMSVSRYIRPIHFQERNHLVLQKETCIAMGADFNHTLQAVPLQPVQNCTAGFRCFKRLDELPTECKVSNDINPWSGCVVCDSGSGIYPAAIFFQPKGRCGFNEALNFTNVAKYKNEIFKNTGQTAITVIPEMCEGFRCNLGNCIGKSQVCNGVPDCRGGDDENSDYCAKMKEYCHLTGDCVCLPDELRCDNGKCVPKEAFCNLNDDCGDNSDEPDRCNCYEYLRLANSSKVCDGIRHCLDRSDEDPQKCSCDSKKFKCESSSLCISNDMVCDGFSDCPNGEDENHCLSLLPLKNSNKMGEVLSLTGGVWHSGCFPQNLLKTELEEICRDIGFSGSSASYLKKTDDVAERPVMDTFTFAWIRKNSKNNLKIGMRSGTQPFVHFVGDPGCFKLYIECL